MVLVRNIFGMYSNTEPNTPEEEEQAHIRGIYHALHFYIKCTCATWCCGTVCANDCVPCKATPKEAEKLVMLMQEAGRLSDKIAKRPVPKDFYDRQKD